MVRPLKNYQNYKHGFKLLERHRILVAQLTDSRTDQCKEYKIEVLLEQLRSLGITKENASEKITEYTNNISIVPAVYNEIAQIIILKSVVLDLGQFNSDQMKFEDWWRRI